MEEEDHMGTGLGVLKIAVEEERLSLAEWRRVGVVGKGPFMIGCTHGRLG